MKSLDELLDDISVMSVDEMDDLTGRENLKDWFAVVDEEGIVAYFSEETAAFRYRLAEINRRLNG